MPAVKLTKTIIDDAKPKAARYVLWDAEVRGLGLKVEPSGAKVFLLYYRTVAGEQRKPKVGIYGSITLPQARDIARDMLAKVRGGGDPSKSRQDSRTAPTVDELCERYVKEHAEPRKKDSSVRSDKQNIRLHLKPKLGKLRVAAVTFEDVDAFHRSMKAKPGAANRALALASKMFNLAERWGWRAQGTNPTKLVARYTEKQKHRDLSEMEIARLAKVLLEAEQPPPTPTESTRPQKPTKAKKGEKRERVKKLHEDPRAIAAIRLLMFTGMRRGEVLALKWSEVDLARSQLNLDDSKTGAKVVRLNSAAKEVIEAQKRVVGSPYVFPLIGTSRPRKGESPSSRSAQTPRHMSDLNGPWYRIRKRAQLEDVRLHDLRHTFATIGIGQGLSLQVVGKLLGHKVAATTNRYADLQDDPARKANEEVGAAIKAAMGAKPGGEVRKLRTKKSAKRERAR